MDDRAVIFDSCEIFFNPTRFVQQFLIHVFFPFFLWLSPNLEVQGYFTLHPLRLLFNWGVPAVVYVMLICAFLSPSYIEGNGDALYPPLMLYLAHRFMVCLKYATMSDSEYHRLMTTKDPTLADKYMLQLQITSGLMGLDPLLTELEIAAAAVRLHIPNLQQKCFRIPSAEKVQQLDLATDRHWKKFIAQALGMKYDEKPATVAQALGAKHSGSGRSGSASFESDSGVGVDTRETLVSSTVKSSASTGAGAGAAASSTRPDLEVPLSLVCSALLNRAGTLNKPYVGYMQLVGVTGILIMVVQPYFVAYEDSHSGLSIVFYCCSTFLNMIFGNIIVLFLTAVFFDAMRRYTTAVELGFMLQQACNTENCAYYGYSPPDSVYSNRGYMENTFATIHDSTLAFMDDIGATSAEIKKDKVHSAQPGEEEEGSAGGSARGARGLSGDSIELQAMAMAAVPEDMSMSVSMPMQQYLEAQQLQQQHEDEQELKQQRSRSSSAKRRPHHNYNVLYNRSRGELLVPPPRIHHGNPKNIIAFMQLWQILHDYGLRFRFRLDIYVGALALLTSVMMAALVVVLNSSPHPSATILFRQTMIIVLILVVFIFTIIIMSAGTNYEYVLHTLEISKIMVMVEQHILDKKEALRELQLARAALAVGRAKEESESVEELSQRQSVDHYVTILQAMRVCERAMTLINEWAPIKLLRITVNYALAYTAATGLISFFIYVYSVLETPLDSQATAA